MVAHSSSVWVISHSNLTQLPPLLMHVAKWLAVLMAIKRLARVAPQVLHWPPQKANKAEPTLALKPRGEVTRNPKQGYQCPPPPPKGTRSLCCVTRLDITTLLECKGACHCDTVEQHAFNSLDSPWEISKLHLLPFCPPPPEKIEGARILCKI